MNNKKLLNSLVFLAILGIILASSTFNLFAVQQQSCSGGEYLNKVATDGFVCECGGTTVITATCSFKQWSTCREMKCIVN